MGYPIRVEPIALNAVAIDTANGHFRASAVQADNIPGAEPDRFHAGI
jgi:hypothetical protein